MPVSPREALTRFIFSSSHFAVRDGRVKAPAISPFPHRTTGRLEMSAYRVDTVTTPEIWDICAKHVDDRSVPRIAKARGTCIANIMVLAGLSFDPDGDPHPRHVNVTGWPTAKHEQKNIQQKIAATMELELRS